jgi:XRE family transcriptional regulator, regulator of sulfur utilization
MESSQRIARQVGDTVRRLRSQRGQAQQEIARLAGIPRAALAAFESGQRLPTAPVLASLLAALDCSEESFSRHFGPFGEVESIRRRGTLW